MTAKIPPSFEVPPGLVNGGARQVVIVEETTIHSCTFSFVEIRAPAGKMPVLVFDVPAGAGVARRIAIPFSEEGMARFEAQFRAWRSGVTLP